MVAGSKTLLQQNPTALNFSCWLKQIDLYNDHKIVVNVAVIKVRINSGNKFTAVAFSGHMHLCCQSVM